MLLFGPCSSSYAQSEAAKVVKLNLVDYGWQPLPPRSAGEWQGTTGQLLTIDHKGRVLIGYIVRETEQLAKRGKPTLSFRIVRIKPDGKADLSFALPTNNWFSVGVYLDASDHILARANATLQVLSGGDQTPREQRTWTPIATCTMNCDISQSPSRHTLIVQNPVSPDHFTYTVLDTSSSDPQVIRTCSAMAFYAQRITDKFAYWPGSYGMEYWTRRYPLCDEDHPEELPLDQAVDIALNDELLVFRGAADHKSVMGVITVEGKIKFRLELPKGDRQGRATGDERGDRFAIGIGTYRGGFAALDIPEKPVANRIVVLDSQSGRQLASVPIKVRSSVYEKQLSPDGHCLAILEDGILTIVELQ